MVCDEAEKQALRTADSLIRAFSPAQALAGSSSQQDPISGLQTCHVTEPHLFWPGSPQLFLPTVVSFWNHGCSEGL